MFIRPGAEVKSVEADALVANGYLNQMWPHFEIEPVAVHAKIGWGVSEAYESGEDPRSRHLGHGVRRGLCHVRRHLEPNLLDIG